VKNLTVSIPDDVYRLARVRAAESDTSVSSLVADHLRSLGGRDAEFARLEARQRAAQERIARFRAGDRLSRDELHERTLR